MTSRRPDASARAARLRIAIGIACAAVALHVEAQGVVKCIDRDGNVTYQDSPCTGGQSGRSVELPKAETREDTSAWEAAARDGRVIRGMPKRWVLRSRGAPLEIRPGGPREDASEVWRYPGKEGVLLVGFAGPNVGWVRDEPVPRAGSGPAPAAAAGTKEGSGAAGAATRGAQNRRFVIEGRDCEHVWAEIGVADREDPTVSGAGTAGRRYVYEPREGDPAMRTVFSCVNGKVTDVERTLVR